MRSKFLASTLAIALGLATLVVSAIVFPGVVMAQTVEEKKKEADRPLQQGIQQYQVSQFEAALQSWQQSLKLYRELKDRLGEGAALWNLGVAYDSLGNYPKAIDYHEQRLAIAIFRKADYRGGGARTFCIRNHSGLSAFHHRDARVSGS